MDIGILTVPYDSGIPDRGMGLGPGRILETGLRERLRAAGHESRVDEIRVPGGSTRGEAALAQRLWFRLSRAVRSTVADGGFPLVLAGPCYSAVGTVVGLGPDPLGVVWLDAHADLNTPETSRSGFLDGMALSILTGRCWKGLTETLPGFVPVADEAVLLMAARDLDPPEEELLRNRTIALRRASWCRQDPSGALDSLAHVVDHVYLHVDLDVVDPSEARANPFAAPGGLTVAEVLALAGAVKDRFRIRALSLTAYDPGADPEGRIAEAALSVVETVLPPR